MICTYLQIFKCYYLYSPIFKWIVPIFKWFAPIFKWFEPIFKYDWHDNIHFLNVKGGGGGIVPRYKWFVPMMYLSFVDVWYVHLNIIHLHLGVNDLNL